MSSWCFHSGVYIVKAATLSKIMKRRDLIRQNNFKLVALSVLFYSHDSFIPLFLISNGRRSNFDGHVCCRSNRMQHAEADIRTWLALRRELWLFIFACVRDFVNIAAFLRYRWNQV